MSLYTLLRLLSLDIVAGSLCGAAMAVWLCEVRMPMIWWLLLPLCVWLAYTLDHLLDARKLGALAHTPRHRFHFTHFHSLTRTAVVLCLLGLVLALYLLPRLYLIAGLVLALLTALHLVLVLRLGSHVSPWLVKEAAVALIYTLGIWLCPFLSAGGEAFGLVLCILPLYFLLALANLLLFAVFEVRIDERDRHGSFIRAVGWQTGRRIVSVICLLVLIACLLLAVGFALEPKAVLAAAGLAAMALTLLGINLRPDYFASDERYRMLGDAVFLIPLLPALIGAQL